MRYFHGRPMQQKQLAPAIFPAHGNLALRICVLFARFSYNSHNNNNNCDHRFYEFRGFFVRVFIVRTSYPDTIRYEYYMNKL